GTSLRRRQYFHHADHSSQAHASGHAKSRCMAGKARTSPLAAGHHDSSHPAFRGRVRGDLVAAVAGRIGTAKHRGNRITYGWRTCAGRVDDAPWPSDPRLSRAENVEALLAEPRSTDVRRILEHGGDVCGIVAALI